MKRLALFTAAFGLAFCAAAQTPAAGPVDPAAPHAASATATDAETADTKTPEDKLADRHCLKETGSRIVRADRNGRKCASVAGRAYTKEDLDRSGEINLADALRKLDTSVR